MVNPTSSQVPMLRAAVDYIKDPDNCVWAAFNACFLAKQVSSSDQFPWSDKIESALGDGSIFGNTQGALSAFHQLPKDLGDGLKASQNPNEVQKIQTERKGDFPSQELPFWTVCKTASAICTIAVFIFTVPSTLKGLGVINNEVFGSRVQNIGKALGLLGSAITIIDTTRAYFTTQDNPGGPSLLKVIPKEGEKEVSDADKGLYLEKLQGGRLWTIRSSIFSLSIKVALALAPATCSWVLVGRVSQFVVNHQGTIPGILSITSYVLGLIGYIHYGATVKHLESPGPDAAKKMSVEKSRSERIIGYLCNNLFVSKRFLGLIDNGVKVLDHRGVETLAGAQLAPLGKAASGMLGFSALPKMLEDMDSLITSGERDFSHVFSKTVSLTGNVLGSLKWLGVFGGVALLSSHTKAFGNLKSVCTICGTSLAILKDSSEIHKEYSSKFEDQSDMSDRAEFESARRRKIAMKTIDIALSVVVIGLSMPGALEVTGNIATWGMRQIDRVSPSTFTDISCIGNAIGLTKEMMSIQNRNVTQPSKVEVSP